MSPDPLTFSSVISTSSNNETTEYRWKINPKTEEKQKMREKRQKRRDVWMKQMEERRVRFMSLCLPLSVCRLRQVKTPFET